MFYPLNYEGLTMVLVIQDGTHDLFVVIMERAFEELRPGDPFGCSGVSGRGIDRWSVIVKCVSKRTHAIDI